MPTEKGSMTSSSPQPQGLVRTACDGILKDPAGYPTDLYRGKIVYFCTRACRRVFRLDPDRFMAGEIEHPIREDPLEPNEPASDGKG